MNDHGTDAAERWQQMARLHGEKAEAALAVARIKGDLAEARRREREAEDKLAGYIQAQLRPLPLFDAPPVREQPPLRPPSLESCTVAADEEEEARAAVLAQPSMGAARLAEATARGRAGSKRIGVAQVRMRVLSMDPAAWLPDSPGLAGDGLDPDSESVQLAWKQLLGYPAWWGAGRDMTAREESEIAADRAAGRPEPKGDTALVESICRFRECQREGKEPTYGTGWAEFEFAQPGAMPPIKAVWNDARITSGWLFWGAVSETGFRSVMSENPQEGETLRAWGERLARGLVEAHVGKPATEAPKAKPKKPRKAKAAPLPPEDDRETVAPGDERHYAPPMLPGTGESAAEAAARILPPTLLEQAAARQQARQPEEPLPPPRPDARLMGEGTCEGARLAVWMLPCGAIEANARFDRLGNWHRTDLRSEQYHPTGLEITAAASAACGFALEDTCDWWPDEATGQMRFAFACPDAHPEPWRMHALTTDPEMADWIVRCWADNGVRVLGTMAQRLAEDPEGKRLMKIKRGKLAELLASSAETVRRVAGAAP